jgi:hypothetical protein
MLGKWTDHGTFAKGANAPNTFSTQVTEVVKVRGKKDAYIFVGDRWRDPTSRTFDIFLPIMFAGLKDMAIYWQDKWDIDTAFKN